MPDAEGRRAANEIWNVLGAARWIPFQPIPNPDLWAPAFDGVNIEPYAAAYFNEDAKTGVRTPRKPPQEELIWEEESDKATCALIDFIHSNHWQWVRRFAPLAGRGEVPLNTIKIMIGFKPSPYFATKEKNDLHDFLRKRNKERMKLGLPPEQEKPCG